MNRRGSQSIYCGVNRIVMFVCRLSQALLPCPFVDTFSAARGCRSVAGGQVFGGQGMAFFTCCFIVRPPPARLGTMYLIRMRGGEGALAGGAGPHGGRGCAWSEFNACSL